MSALRTCIECVITRDREVIEMNIKNKSSNTKENTTLNIERKSDKETVRDTDFGGLNIERNY